MELVIILLLICFIIWIVWKVREMCAPKKMQRSNRAERPTTPKGAARERKLYAAQPEIAPTTSAASRGYTTTNLLASVRNVSGATVLQTRTKPRCCEWLLQYRYFFARGRRDSRSRSRRRTARPTPSAVSPRGIALPILISRRTML